MTEAKRLTILCILFLPGCALDPLERLEDQTQAKHPADRQAAIAELAEHDESKAINLLASSLETDPEMLEEAGNALVEIGRRYDKHHPPQKQSAMYPNPVVKRLGETAAKPNMEWPVRAKAVWCLGEIGNRKAKPWVEGTYAGDSTRVAEEAALARDKLGFTDQGASRELLREGKTLASYDPEERWEHETHENAQD